MKKGELNNTRLPELCIVKDSGHQKHLVLTASDIFSYKTYFYRTKIVINSPKIVFKVDSYNHIQCFHIYGKINIQRFKAFIDVS